MSTTFTGSSFSVPKNANSLNLKPKVGQKISLDGFEFINLLNRYDNLITSLEMFKNLFVQHGKNAYLIELVEDLETVVLFTKNQIKLELQENLTNKGL
jgi:hypothetical protein